MGFPTTNDHFGVFWGYHHFRKHPYVLFSLCTCGAPNIWNIYVKPCNNSHLGILSKQNIYYIKVNIWNVRVGTPLHFNSEHMNPDKRIVCLDWFFEGFWSSLFFRGPFYSLPPFSFPSREPRQSPANLASCGDLKTTAQVRRHRGNRFN